LIEKIFYDLTVFEYYGHGIHDVKTNALFTLGCQLSQRNILEICFPFFNE